MSNKIDRLRGRVVARRCAQLLAAVAPAVQAMGLGIGEQSQVSRLFEPLRVEIPLELDGLPPEDVQVELGLDAVDAEAHPANGTANGAALRREIVVDAAGHAVLRVSAADPVREPMLRLHVDLSGAGLHVWRNLTLMFDPASPVPTAARAAVVHERPPAGAAPAQGRAEVRPQAAAPATDAAAPKKKPAAHRPAVAAAAKNAAPQREAGGMRLLERLSTRPHASAQASAPVAPPAANRAMSLKLAEGLSATSQLLVHAGVPGAKAGDAGVPAAAPAVVSPGVAAPPASAASAAPSAAAATVTAPQDGTAAAANPPAAVAVPPAAGGPAGLPAVGAPPAPAVQVKPAVANEEHAPFSSGLLLGLLALAALAFGWLFRSLRVVQAPRRTPSASALAGWTATSEMSDALLEMDRGAARPAAPVPSVPPAPIQPAPVPPIPVPPPVRVAPREVAPLEFDLSDRPAPAPAAETAPRQPLQAFAEEWSPADFDLAQPLDDSRTGRR